jgi:UDP-glucose 4-epimerase
MGRTALAGLQGRRVLVTGGDGFIGAHVVRRALDEGARVAAVLRPGKRPARLAPRERLELIERDIADGDGLTELLQAERPDLVLHLAAIADWRQDPSLTIKMIQAHVLGTGYLLEAARKAGVARVVLFGSAGEYGDHDRALTEEYPGEPLDPYSATKLAATMLALTYHRSFHLACTVVRPFLVYGPGEGQHRLLPSTFARSLQALTAAERTMEFTTGEQRRDFVYVEDVAEGALRAAITPAAAGEILNLGTGVATSVREIVQAAIEIAGSRVIAQFGARPQRAGEPRLLLADMRKTRRILGWQPTVGVSDGLREFWRSIEHPSN